MCDLAAVRRRRMWPVYVAQGLRQGPSLRLSSLRRVAVGNVVAFGLVSMFTDISSEMVTSILPAFLVLGLGLSVVQFGVLDGLYTGATALTRLLGGYLADRFRQRKVVAGVGYGLSALAKLGLLLVGSAPAALGAVLAVDRTGKGIRTAPRDALVASAVDPRDLGQAFGLHRAMDTPRRLSRSADRRRSPPSRGFGRRRAVRRRIRREPGSGADRAVGARAVRTEPVRGRTRSPCRSYGRGSCRGSSAARRSAGCAWSRPCSGW